MGFHVSLGGLGFRFGVYRLGFRVQGLRFGGLGFSVSSPSSEVPLVEQVSLPEPQ